MWKQTRVIKEQIAMSSGAVGSSQGIRTIIAGLTAVNVTD